MRAKAAKKTTASARQTSLGNELPDLLPQQVVPPTQESVTFVKPNFEESATNSVVVWYNKAPLTRLVCNSALTGSMSNVPGAQLGYYTR